jgi:signal transduction histidine kinase
VGFGVGHAAQLRRLAREDRSAEERAEAGIAAASASTLLAARRDAAGRRAALRALATETLAVLERRKHDALGRVLIVTRDGTVVADAVASPAARGRVPPGGDWWPSRPEIRAALRGDWMQARRASRELGSTIEVTAGPVPARGRGPLALRVSVGDPGSRDAAASQRALRSTAEVGAAVLVFGLLAAAMLARQLTRPLRALESAARAIADGDLSRIAPVAGAREHRVLAGAFNRMTERLVSLIHRQQMFVADASHQLRTPLAAHRLRLELLARRLDDREAADRELQLALGEADRLRDVLDRVLARTAAAGDSRELGSVELLDACRAAIDRWQMVGADRGIAVRLDPASVASRAGGDAEDLQLMLDVLLENALDYAPSRSVVTIAVGPRTIEIADEGPGLAPDELERVFERSYRGTAGRATAGGAGLGLAIAREVAERWGASLTLQNRESGSGALARIVLRPEQGA